jgi:hypothetical protein
MKSDSSKTRFISGYDSDTSSHSEPVAPREYRKTDQKKKRKAQRTEPHRSTRTRTLAADLALRSETLSHLREKGVEAFYTYDSHADTKLKAFSVVADFLAENLLFREAAALASSSSWLLDCVYSVHHSRRCIVIGSEAPSVLVRTGVK